jgi:uncharacterized protein YjbJ (UPF0337 family)
MSMEDLLQAILGGAGTQMPSQGAQGSAQENPLADILGSILGGGAQQPSGSAQQGAGDIGDIIGSIFGGGAQQPSGSAQQGVGDIGDIIGSIFGGGAQQPSRGAQQGAGGIGDILGGILGGGSGMNSNTFLGPIVQKLAEQLGLPPAIAQMVVSFVLSKMMGSAAAKSQATLPSQATPSQRGAQGVPQAQQGLDLDDLLGQMSTGQTLNTSYFQATGLTQELSQKTGLDSDTAATSLQEVLKMLGGALGSAQQTRQPTRAQRTGAGATQRKTSKSKKSTSRKRSTPNQRFTV